MTARTHLVALAASAAAHGLLFSLAGNHLAWLADRPDPRKADETVVVLAIVPAQVPPRAVAPEREVAPAAPARPAEVPAEPSAPGPSPERRPASMAAPPAPTAEEWGFAARYTLKNSKGYRHRWGQQVRSMMGTAVEGADLGSVRFRVEIAPDGTVTRLETLWATSAVAERLAREAIAKSPPLPPTPTGRPLTFDRTISFTLDPWEGPPVHHDDCLPDPPAFSNPWVWDGRSEPVRRETAPAGVPDPQALEECLKQLPQDAIDAVNAADQRVLDRWGSRKLAPAR